jgi:hypothetical protein
MQDRISKVRQAILDKDLKTLGPLIEMDCISMHMVMMTSNPPAYYWNAGTMDIIQSVLKWREEERLQAYFTIELIIIITLISYFSKPLINSTPKPLYSFEILYN